MPAPSTFLNWIPTGNTAYITQPTTGQAATGWTAGEAPPFQYMNWLFYQTDQWIQYLAGVALIAPTAATVSASNIAATTTGSYTSGSNVLTIASATGVKAGQTVTAVAGGIPTSTIVIGVSGTTITLSAAATSTQTGVAVVFNHSVATGTLIQTQLDALDAATELTATSWVTTGNTTNNSTSVTSLADTTNILPGQLVTGTGIAASTYVQAISGSTIVLSIAATATNTATALTFSHGIATGSTIQRQIDALDASLGVMKIPALAYTSTITLNATDPTDIIVNAPTSNIVFTLPTTGVLRGKKFRIRLILGAAAQTVTVNSSSGGLVDVIQGDGTLEVMALVNTPTSAGNWIVLSVNEIFQFVTNWTFNSGSPFTPSPNWLYISRQNRNVLCNFSNVTATAPAGNSNLQSITGIPSRFYPTDINFLQPTAAALIYNNAAIQSTPGSIQLKNLGAAGQFSVQTNWTTGGWTSGALGGLLAATLSWTL